MKSAVAILFLVCYSAAVCEDSAPGVESSKKNSFPEMPGSLTAVRDSAKGKTSDIVVAFSGQKPATAKCSTSQNGSVSILDCLGMDVLWGMITFLPNFEYVRVSMTVLGCKSFDPWLASHVFKKENFSSAFFLEKDLGMALNYTKHGDLHAYELRISGRATVTVSKQSGGERTCGRFAGFRIESVGAAIKGVSSTRHPSIILASGSAVQRNQEGHSRNANAREMLKIHFRIVGPFLMITGFLIALFVIVLQKKRTHVRGFTVHVPSGEQEEQSSFKYQKLQPLP